MEVYTYLGLQGIYFVLSEGYSSIPQILISRNSYILSSMSMEQFLVLVGQTRVFVEWKICLKCLLTNKKNFYFRGFVHFRIFDFLPWKKGLTDRQATNWIIEAPCLALGESFKKIKSQTWDIVPSSDTPPPLNLGHP